MGYCVPRIWERVCDLGRVFLIYFLIYQQIFMGVAWANGGLRMIQADLHEIVRHTGSYGPQVSSASTIRFSAVPVEVREEFKGCDWVFRKAQGKAQALYYWQGQFYEVHHPELLQSVQMLKRGKDQESSSLYIKSLLEGLGQKNLSVGLESEGEIVIEDSIQLKRLVTFSPLVVNRAMAALDSAGKLKGIDVDLLEMHGSFKLEGGSTLNTQALHLYEGTFINQGTLRFKRAGRAHLYGNDFVNEHKIKGVNGLTLYKGGVLKQGTSRSQLRLKEGTFVYEGQGMVSDREAIIEAQKIKVKTLQDLSSLPLLKGKHLRLEASSLEGCDLQRVTMFKKLKLISVTSPLIFSDPLNFSGIFKGRGAFSCD
jgi:hypothetical protein